MTKRQSIGSGVVIAAGVWASGITLTRAQAGRQPTDEQRAERAAIRNAARGGQGFQLGLELPISGSWDSPAMAAGRRLAGHGTSIAASIASRAADTSRERKMADDKDRARHTSQRGFASMCSQRAGA